MGTRHSSGDASSVGFSGASRSYSLGDYFVVNLIVWGLLLVVGLIAYFGIDRAPVIPFLLLVVGCGFTLISVYDFAFDRLGGSLDLRDGEDS
ncbi:MAG: hypothetical protein JW941_07125 [Candidatus Coatesbacteria bacterium]|nr:hypothetical protein [Candidatus Coatesbacteria bacterium]